MISNAKNASKIKAELQKFWAKLDAWRKEHGIPNISEKEADELAALAKKEVRAERAARKAYTPAGH